MGLHTILRKALLDQTETSPESCFAQSSGIPGSLCVIFIADSPPQKLVLSNKLHLNTDIPSSDHGQQPLTILISISLPHLS